ncbi:alpha/beta hydrolase [Lentzea tibetensis]|nr:alpha/beta hydrolase [Lentzea tibetensis]
MLAAGRDDRASTVGAVVTLLVALLLAPPASATALACEDMDVAGTRSELCTSGSPTVLVLVPGAGYNSTYWDFPYQPEKYSFQRAMNRSGFATVTFDRLGTGRSSVPLGVTVTSTRQAAVLHEVVQSLRDKGYRRVVLVGHSMGSVDAIFEAGTYHDVDGVVLTGFTHQLDVANVADGFRRHSYPAPLDPKFPGYDPGYLSTRPGHRAEMFYFPGSYDPHVVSLDEQTKDVFSAAEMADGMALGIIAPYSAAITVPVLVVAGGEDTLFCGNGCTSQEALFSLERPYFVSSPDVRLHLRRGVGHNLNLHLDAEQVQAVVRDWLNG